jgi:hypothetical protein
MIVNIFGTIDVTIFSINFIKIKLDSFDLGQTKCEM